MILINYLNDTGYKFSHISEMKIETIIDKRDMSYDYYMKQPKPMVESKLNQILAKNSQLINVLDRRVNHPLIKKYFHIPINI